MRYVIIGNSAAGVNAGEEIRRKDKESEIIIISDEKDIAYSRCLISRFLDGRLDENQLYFKTKNFYRDFNIKPILGKRVAAIDTSGQSISLDNGERFSYDKLLLAIGSTPARPKICGLDLEGVFNFYSLEDMRKINKSLKNVKKAVIAGAGFAGLEAAYALRKLGINVTVVERCSQILPNQFDYISSELIREDLEGMGVEVILNESLTSINGCGKIESVTIGEDTDISCSMVIFATGVRPNTQLASDAGLSKGKGIFVDEFLKTSGQNIYAAGDCIEIEDISTGKRQVSATWFNAVLQGKFSALNMLGIAKRYSGLVGIQNAVQFHRLGAISFGMTQVTDDDLDYEVISHYQKDGKIYKKLVVKDDYLCGMIFVGDILKAGFYAALIRNKINISDFKGKLLDPDFSHAYFKNENFDQVSSYAPVPSCWQDPQHWLTERSMCMGIR